MPLTFTTDPAVKFDPLTVSVNAPLPVATDDGEILEIDGTGLSASTANGIKPITAALSVATATAFTKIFLNIIFFILVLSLFIRPLSAIADVYPLKTFLLLFISKAISMTTSIIRMPITALLKINAPLIVFV